MHEAGMEIGAHTHTHPSLTRVSVEVARDELRRSKSILEDRLQVPVTSFAYPFGKPRVHFSGDTMRLAESVGFERAVAIHYRGVHSTDSPFSIPRFAVTSDSLKILAAKVDGRIDPLGWWQGCAPARLSRMTANDPADSMLDHHDRDQQEHGVLLPT
jgi:peptidoglycan/xylan/chitin deacetylase (PgdA/CDA1 family)